MEGSLHDLVLITERCPLGEDADLGNARIVAGEHDLVLQPTAHVDLEDAGPHREILGALVLAGILGRVEPRVADYKAFVEQAAESISIQAGGGTGRTAV